MCVVLTNCVVYVLESFNCCKSRSPEFSVFFCHSRKHVSLNERMNYWKWFKNTIKSASTLQHREDGMLLLCCGDGRADDGTNFPESAKHDKADLVIWRRGDSRMTTAVQ